MSLLEAALFLLVAVTATVVVFSKRALSQLFVYSAYGGVMTLLFFVLHAPDVALSELTVGVLAVPLMALVALMKTGDKL